jgi:c-di-GMP-binding flagellar brake protein YcgR
MSHPDNLLFQSRIEICRILQVLAQELCPVFAELSDEHLFNTQILAVDAEAEHFFIGYSPNKSLNSALLKLPSVELTASNQPDLYFSFNASAPKEAQFNGQAAIRFNLPNAMLKHNRREHTRIKIPSVLSLRCIAESDSVMPFESHITDISHDGLGCLIYDTDIKLETGAILRHCRIITPEVSVMADLELRNIRTVTLSDGSLAYRAGFRFVEKTATLSNLVRLFIRDLGTPKIIPTSAAS